MIVDPWFYLAASVAVLVVGLAKGGLGGGIGVIAVPLMATVISPVQAAAILLPMLMVMDALAMRAYWRLWDWRYLRVLIPASLAGVALGFLTARSISVDGLRIMVAAVALAYAVVDVRRRAGSDGGPDAVAATLWGATSGFTSFSIHAGGPPLQAYLLPRCADRTTFQATSIVFFFFVNWAKVLPYAWLGQWSRGTLLTSLVLLPLAPVGVWAGRRLHLYVSDSHLLPRRARGAAGHRRQADLRRRCSRPLTVISRGSEPYRIVDRQAAGLNGRSERQFRLVGQFENESGDGHSYAGVEHGPPGGALEGIDEAQPWSPRRIAVRHRIGRAAAANLGVGPLHPEGERRRRQHEQSSGAQGAGPARPASRRLPPALP